MNEIYNCPIQETIGTIQSMMATEHEQQILRIVQQVGITIDKNSLVEALQNDRHRYEEAYKKGYADCQKKYEDKLKRIADILDHEYVNTDCAYKNKQVYGRDNR